MVWLLWWSVYVCIYNILVSGNLFHGSISFKFFWNFFRGISAAAESWSARGNIDILKHSWFILGHVSPMCFWFVLRTTCLCKLFVYHMHVRSGNADLLLEVGRKGPKDGWICLVIFFHFLCPALLASWNVASLCGVRLFSRGRQMWWIYLLCISSPPWVNYKNVLIPNLKLGGNLSACSNLFVERVPGVACADGPLYFLRLSCELVVESEGETGSSSLMKIKSIFDKIKINFWQQQPKGRQKMDVLKSCVCWSVPQPQEEGAQVPDVLQTADFPGRSPAVQLLA